MDTPALPNELITRAHAIPGPRLILIRGLPGGGKSYIAAGLQQVFGASRTTILDPDHIDKTSGAYTTLSEALTTDGVDQKFHPNRFLKSVGYGAIDAGHIIIWNQGFTDWHGFQRSAGSLQEYAAAHNVALPVLIVEVTIDPQVAQARIATRASSGGHNVPNEAFSRFVRDYQSFAKRGFDTITVNGQNDIAESVGEILRALS